MQRQAREQGREQGREQAVGQARWVATLAMVGALAAGVLGCGGADVRVSAPPTAEFLIAAGDSTYWVETGAFGVRLRGAPILVTQVDDRWYEVHIVEQGVDYLDAEFVQERLLGVVIATGDSVLLFSDDAVPESHGRWLAAHPEEAPIDPEAEPAPEPTSSATDYLEVIDVHGRYLSWGHALDIDVTSEPGHTHRLRRGVSDLRTGARITLDSLMTTAEAQALALRGQATLDNMLQMVRGVEGERAERARETLASFTFDPAAFSLADVGQAPAVVFHVAGTGSEGEALELLLPPLLMEQSPPGWSAVRRRLPIWSADSLAFRWPLNGEQTLEGAVDSSGDRLMLRLVVDSLSRSWALGSVPRPLHQLTVLESAARDGREREALRGAFTRAAMGDPFGVQTVGPARPRSWVQSRWAAGGSSESGRTISIPSRATCVLGKTARASDCRSSVSRE